MPGMGMPFVAVAKGMPHQGFKGNGANELSTIIDNIQNPAVLTVAHGFYHLLYGGIIRNDGRLSFSDSFYNFPHFHSFNFHFPEFPFSFAHCTTPWITSVLPPLT